ncbi:MAG: hypothetical protein AAF368_18080 [Planctomycetota bacterium]
MFEETAAVSDWEEVRAGLAFRLLKSAGDLAMEKESLDPRAGEQVRRSLRLAMKHLLEAVKELTKEAKP